MTYAELKASVLSLINQYSIAGQEIDLTYNNQQDYINRIPMLADDAQMQIATTAKLIPAEFPVKNLMKMKIGDGNMYRYEMPSDFFKFRKFALIDVNRYPAREIPLKGYFTENAFICPEITSPGVFVSYYRYPFKLGLNPRDTDFLDNTEDAQRVVALHVASHIVMYDDAYQHSQLYNEYEVQLSRLQNGIVTETDDILDVYSNGIHEYYRR